MPTTNLNEYLRTHRSEKNHYLTKQIKTKNGVTLSVQASEYHYCSPREDEGPWDKVEVGFPSEKLEELMPYAESPETPTDTVYGYVPIEIVEEVIDRLGGIDYTTEKLT